MNKTMSKRFKNTVITGLQLLMTLQLPGRPPQDSIAATAEIWLDLLYPVRRWDDEDIANLQRAFKRVARRAEHFPPPAAIIAALEPKIIVTEALPSPPKTEAEKAEIDRICQEIAGSLSLSKNKQTRLPINTNTMRIIHEKK